MVAELSLDFGLERDEKVKMDASTSVAPVETRLCMIGWGKDPLV